MPGDPRDVNGDGSVDINEWLAGVMGGAGRQVNQAQAIFGAGRQAMQTLGKGNLVGAMQAFNPAAMQIQKNVAGSTATGVEPWIQNTQRSLINAAMAKQPFNPSLLFGKSQAPAAAPQGAPGGSRMPVDIGTKYGRVPGSLKVGPTSGRSPGVKAASSVSKSRRV